MDDAFFDVFDVPLLAGRVFATGDFDASRTVVVVNRTFTEQFLGDALSGASLGDLLGRRIRYLPRNGEESAESRTWYEIVGVVADLPAHATNGTMYHPQAPGQLQTSSLALRVGSDPASVADPLREIVRAVDPALRVDGVFTLDEIYRQQEVGNNFGALALVVATTSVLLLSAAGIYALMSFTVNRRRREVGIRSALGAQPHQVLAGIFRRAFAQLAVGALGGVALALTIDSILPIENLGGWTVPGVIPGAVLFMVLVGLLAAFGPAHRGLQVEPTEVLRQG